MANSLFRGAFFKDPPINDGKTHPVGHIALEVLGVKLSLAVWPAATSKSGTKYSPISGDYDRKEMRRLVDVTPVMGAGTAPAAAPADAAATETTADGGEPLPF